MSAGSRRGWEFALEAVVSAFLLGLALGGSLPTAVGASLSAERSGDSLDPGNLFDIDVGFSRDGKLLLTDLGGAARIWDANGRLLHTLGDSAGRASLSPDGTLVLDGKGRIWDAASGRLLHTLPPGRHTFSPDGKLVLTVGGKPPRIWETATGRLLHTLRGQAGTVESAVFSPDGRFVVATTESGPARVWETAMGRLLYTLRSDPRSSFFAIVAFSPDGTKLLTLGDSSSKARIRDAASGRLLQTLSSPGDELESAVWSPDGALVATAGAFAKPRIWNAATGKLMHAINGAGQYANRAVFSPDGALLVSESGSDPTEIWDVATGRHLHTLRKSTGDPSIVFSPDGRLLLTPTRDGAQLWELASGRLLTQLRGQLSFIDGAAFSPAGDLVVTASEDGTARIWNVAGGRLRSILDIASRGPCSTRSRAAHRKSGALSFVRGPSIMRASLHSGRVSTDLRGRLTGDPTLQYFEPAWTNDGRCLAFTLFADSSATGNDVPEVYARRRDGKAFALDGHVSPSWAPGGRRLVLVNQESANLLSIQGLDDGTRIDLDHPNVDDSEPAWSPDGSTIAFSGGRSGHRHLYVIRPDRTGLKRLTTTTANNPSWSPDGRRLVFDDGQRIAVINADGKHLRYLTQRHPPRLDVNPAWSPDGRTIAFVRAPSESSQRGDIWLMNPSGWAQRLFLKNGSEPAWKPD